MAATLTPILNCIQVEPGPSYIAVWGYSYSGILPLTLALGPGNSFSPAPSNRGQPIIFTPGTHNDVFSTAFTTTLTWTLQAPLQPSPNSVTATSSSSVCTFCPPGQSKDCLGVCGGTAVLDCAGVCNGTAVKDCAGVCNGTSVKDCNGVCNGTAKFDCLGVCGGSAVPDCAGICNGTAVNDCAGVCAGTASKDCAGVCNGTSSKDCAGVCNGTSTIDCASHCHLPGQGAYADCGGNCIICNRIDVKTGAKVCETISRRQDNPIFKRPTPAKSKPPPSIMPKKGSTVAAPSLPTNKVIAPPVKPLFNFRS